MNERVGEVGENVWVNRNVHRCWLVSVWVIAR